MKKSFHIVIILLSLASGFAQAGLINIEQKVYSQDNLYYTDWGHWWTQYGDGDSLAPDANGALGDGQAARAISFNNTFFAFNRNQIQSLTVSVTGSVIDNGSSFTNATGNDCYINQLCGFNNGYFHNLPVYSVIGLWSTTADTITPVKYDAYGNAYAAGDAGYDALPATTSAPFFVGTGGVYDFSMLIPDSVDDLFLFLAENDGTFSDNNPEQFYIADITIQTPEPSAAWLAGVGLIALGIISRRRQIA